MTQHLDPTFTAPFVDVVDQPDEPLALLVDTPSGTVRVAISLSQAMWLMGRLSMALALRVDWNGAALPPRAPDSGPSVQ